MKTTYNKTVTSMAEEDLKFIEEEDNNYLLFSSLNNIDNIINDIKNNTLKQLNYLKQISSTGDSSLRQISDFNNYKNTCLQEDEKKLKKIKILKEYKISADKEINELKDKLRKKEEENYKLSNYIYEYKKDISRLEKMNQEMKSQHNAEIAKILAWDSKNNPLKTDLEIKKAIEEYKKQNEMSKKQIVDMEEQIKMLRYKLGNKTIPLSSLADGLKRYAQIYGLKEGKDLLMSLSYLLKHEQVWTHNVDSLENFFIEAEKENNVPLLKVENNNGGLIQISDTEHK